MLAVFLFVCFFFSGFISTFLSKFIQYFENFNCLFEEERESRALFEFVPMVAKTMSGYLKRSPKFPVFY